MTSSAYRECEACHARVILARSHGRVQVLDWQPAPDGTFAARQEATGGWTCRASAPGETLTFPDKRYASHYVTSPTCTPPSSRDAARRQEALQDARGVLAAMRERSGTMQGGDR